LKNNTSAHSVQLSTLLFHNLRDCSDNLRHTDAYLNKLYFPTVLLALWSQLLDWHEHPGRLAQGLHWERGRGLHTGRWYRKTASRS